MMTNINFKELLNQAIEESRYYGSVSFFETRDKGELAALVGETIKIEDAAYIKPKDEDKEEYAVVGYKDIDGKDKFVYVNRNAKDFVRRIAEISRENKTSIKKILEQVELLLTVKKQLKDDAEGQEFMTVNGIANWFYVYELATK